MTIRTETIGDATLYLGDWRDVVEERDDLLRKIGFDAALITDPPYSSGGYQEAGKGAGSIGSTVKHEIFGDTYTTRGYLRLIKGMCHAFRVAEVYAFTDWRMWPYTLDAIEDGGFRIRSMLVWDKGHGGMGIKWRSQHELICWAARGALAPGWGTGNVLRVPRSGNEHHPTEKPVDLMRAIVAASKRPLIVDPFMGSGSTGVAALQRGCKFVGFEIDSQHFATACRRIADARRQMDFLDAPQVLAQPLQQKTLGLC